MKEGDVVVGQFYHIVTRIKGNYYNGYGTVVSIDGDSFNFRDNNRHTYRGIKFSETVFTPETFKDNGKH